MMKAPMSLAITSLRATALVGLVALAPAAAAPASEAEGVWRDVDRVVAVGDLHGANENLVALLESAALLDADGRWSGGASHLVVAGDFLDRGPSEREVMDLLRRLEVESAAAGGRVHVLLGNHEVMALRRDTRYVHPRAYRAWAADETREQRRRAWLAFAGGRLLGGSGTELRIRFSRRYPDGFFGRQSALDPQGDYGSWLLSLPAIVKIDDVVYVHGGLTEEFAVLGVEGINGRFRDELSRNMRLRRELEEVGVVTSVMDSGEAVAAARRELRRRNVPPAVRAAAQGLVISADSPILGARGPVWYRGNALEDERIEAATIDRSLELLSARAMVVAHSYTGGNRITSRFHGRLFRLDHGLGRSPRPLALVVEGGELLVLDAAARMLMRPIPELPPGGVRVLAAEQIADGDLEEFLAGAAIVSSRPLGGGSTRPDLVVLERGDTMRRAIFKRVDRPAAGAAPGDRYQHEVAAYRLDRALGLGLVPVTIEREVEGESGSLQWWVEGAVDRAAAESYGLDLFEDAASVHLQQESALFDALIGNRDRSPSDLLRLPGDERAFLIDHSRAFSAAAELEALDGRPDGAVAERWRAALALLDRPALERLLASFLAADQIAALAARRDRLLDRLTAGGSTAQPAARPAVTRRPPGAR